MFLFQRIENTSFLFLLNNVVFSVLTNNLSIFLILFTFNFIHFLISFYFFRIQESEYSKAQRIYTNLIYQKVPDKVADGLYISSLTPTTEKEVLQKLNIKTILSLGVS